MIAGLFASSKVKLIKFYRNHSMRHCDKCEYGSESISTLLLVEWIAIFIAEQWNTDESYKSRKVTNPKKKEKKNEKKW